MHQPDERQQSARTHRAPVDMPFPPPGGRKITCIYEHHSDFQRDLRRRERQGWKLVDAQQEWRDLPLDLIRASVPGSLLRHSEFRIVAHYTCVVPEMSRLKSTLRGLR